MTLWIAIALACVAIAYKWGWYSGYADAARAAERMRRRRSDIRTGKGTAIIPKHREN